jgi:predicted membrane metal-binding protein
MQSGTHESFVRNTAEESSSDRSFGLVFTAFFALVGLWPMIHKRPFRLWALVLSAIFLLVALAAPKILHPLNVIWTHFGRLLAKVTNPIITGIMFYVIFTPAGVVLRLLGKDLLRLKYDRNATTYWIARDPAGLVPESMRNQF